MSAASSESRPFGRASLTTWSLAALGAGLLLGLLGRAAGGSAFETLANAVKPIGELWVAALQMMVIPLVIAHVLAAIVGARRSESVGALGLRAVCLFIVMLVIAGVLTVFLARPIVDLFESNPGAIASLQAATPVPETARRATVAGSLGEFVANLLPRNLFDAALRGDILPVLLFTALFGIAVTRLPDEHRLPLTRTFQSLAAAMLLCVRWVLWGTPFGAFALTYVLVLETGTEVAGILGASVLIVSGFLILFTAALYPVSAVLGRTPIRVFARAVAPAQLVAASTRSSLASLPALVDGGRRHLRLPASSTSFVLPLSVSLFKVNRTVSSTVKLLFLAHLYGIPLSPATIAVFLVTIIILSFSSVGVPGGGVAFKSLPAYVAAGVPIEGIVIMEAVETIPDIFKTVLNVTADMSAATLLSRSSRPSPRAVSAAEEAGPAAEGTA